MPSSDLTWVDVLRKMRVILQQSGYDQVPQLTSSRFIDVNKTMYVVPPGATGTKRAILIGINYIGQQGELSGCHNDANNVAEFLEKVHGFQSSDMLRLMDDGVNHAPTKQNITNAFERVTQYSQPGDIVFLHYSGEFSFLCMASLLCRANGLERQQTNSNIYSTLHRSRGACSR